MPKNKKSPAQELAAIKIKEYFYRKEFGLSKAEMLQEPMEDFMWNNKIRELFQRKENKENAIIKAQQNAKTQNGIN